MTLYFYDTKTGTFEFKLPSASLDPLDPEFDPKLSVSPVASKGKKGGLGGAIFVSLLDNTTTALVEDGVAIYSGSSGGFNMKAEEAIVYFGFSQAGAQSDTYAIGGTVAYFEQVQKTYKFYWPLVEVQQRLDEKMTRAFQGVPEMYQREKVTMRQAAYLVAISRVTEANKRCGGV
jgi:hypothetical protein